MKVNGRKIAVIGLLFGITGIYSCLKNEITKPYPENQPENMEDLMVSESFDFNATKEIWIETVASELEGKPASKIEIFTGNPNQGGICLQKGISNIKQEYQTKLIIPSHIQTVFIRQTAYNGLTETKELDVGGDIIECAFGQAAKKTIVNPDSGGPGCSDCSSTISGNRSDNLNVNSGETVCILTGASFSGNLTMNGGTLSVCGTLSPRNINGEGTIIINEDGVFMSNNLSINSENLTIKNYSDAFFVSGNQINNNGYFLNYATISVNGINNNTNAYIENHGTLNIGGSFNNNAYVDNSGFLNVGGNYANNSGATTDNYCRFSVGGNYQNNGETFNLSYLEVGGRLTINSGDLELYDQSLIVSNDFTVNGSVNGNGSFFSKIVVEDETRINGSGSVTGSIDLCDASGIESNTGVLGETVTSFETEIPETYCNPGSVSGGGGEDSDTDNDGVEDDFDEYPDDPDRAFNNYFPGEEQFGTLAFEDLWPYKGDYDFNDMIVGYQINQVTNADDKVVDLYIKLVVRAIGAGFFNGFAMELDAPASVVDEVTGDFTHSMDMISLEDNNLESGHDKAVIVFFDNAFDALEHPGGGTGVNTNPNLPWVDPQTLNFHVVFTNPVDEDDLGLPPYNPFIFVDGDRGREVHLKNYRPTALANLSYFGTGNDDSNPSVGRYYTSAQNLPWAMNIAGVFDYPVEKTSIIHAYNYFDEWVESAGIMYPEWYEDETGYRNHQFIYDK